MRQHDVSSNKTYSILNCKYFTTFDFTSCGKGTSRGQLGNQGMLAPTKNNISATSHGTCFQVCWPCKLQGGSSPSRAKYCPSIMDCIKIFTNNQFHHTHIQHEGSHLCNGTSGNEQHEQVVQVATKRYAALRVDSVMPVLGEGCPAIQNKRALFVMRGYTATCNVHSEVTCTIG